MNLNESLSSNFQKLKLIINIFENENEKFPISINKIQIFKKKSKNIYKNITIYRNSNISKLLI